jgi:hippurate hydrolase
MMARNLATSPPRWQPRKACRGRTALGCALALAAALSTARARADDPVKPWVEANLPRLLEFYWELHQAPELSLHEEQTARRLAAQWREAGFEVTERVGGHGIVGLLENGAGKTLMLRCDLDALPVTEQTGLKFASTVTAQGEDGSTTGVMHACGHDVHMTCSAGVAGFLAAHKDRWRGTVMLVGQPAEERGMGARAMLQDGLFDRFPKPDYAVALHCDSTIPTGQIGYRVGYALANVDSVDITVRGRGHGAYPHTTIDPVVQAAHLILDLQTIVSREVKPTEPAVITVGSIHAGTKHNVIADHCKLQLTVRTYSDDVRAQLKAAIVRKAKAAAAAFGAPEPTIEFTDGTPAMFNDRQLAERLAEMFCKRFGHEQVVQTDPSMGGEDFSEYGRRGVSSFMYWLGTVDAHRLSGYTRIGQAPPSLHSPVFYPDAEPTLKTGVQSLAAAALELLPADHGEQREKRKGGT